MVYQPIRDWNGLRIPEPGSYTLDEAHKRIGFTARHMMVSPVRGEFAKATARVVVAEDPLRSAIAATIYADSVNTHNPERDAHLSSADFLDVANYPTLEYRSTGISWLEGNDSIFYWARLRTNPLVRRGRPEEVPAAAARPVGRFLVTGELTVKDVTRPVDLHMEFGGARRDPYGRDIFGFSATAEIEREDFGLLWNVMLETGGVLVGQTIQIEIAGEAIRDTNQAVEYLSNRRPGAVGKNGDGPVYRSVDLVGDGVELADAGSPVNGFRSSASSPTAGPQANRYRAKPVGVTVEHAAGADHSSGPAVPASGRGVGR